MSGGEFLDMRPHIKNKTSNAQFDESTDTFDTIDWLVKVIDVAPSAAPDGNRSQVASKEKSPNGRHELVRAAVIRGRFREGFSTHPRFASLDPPSGRVTNPDS